MNKKYLTPQNLNEVISLYEQYSTSAKYIAGGTDLIMHYKQKNITNDVFIDISNIEELKSIQVNNNELIIGAGVTLNTIITHPLIIEYYPILKEAARSIASPVIRFNATIGGNLLCENRCVFYDQTEWWRNSIGRCLKCEGDVCIATGGRKNCFSKSSSDMAPVLLACDAKLTILSTHSKTKETKNLSEIYSGDGISPHRLKSGDLIVSIHLPLVKCKEYYYYKLRQRQSLDFSSLTIAAVKSNNVLKIGLGSVDPAPIIWEYYLNTDLVFSEWLSNKIKKVRIVDNDFFSREYRKQILQIQLENFYKKITNE
ncbi:MAG: hypothetical protein KatS3mg027_0941 [Bacteroidia bacterium]|nr:MAG: hypothetical protein KatS3mg027_0941 [Bacteroidia bacterium]